MLQASCQSMILHTPPALKWCSRTEFLLLSHLFVLILRACCPDLYLRSELNGLLAGRILLHWVMELQSPVTGNFVPYVDINCLCLETILYLKLISISALRCCFIKICHKVITFLLTSRLMLLLSMRVCILNCFSRVRLCNPMNCSPPSSSVHGFLQARILEWVAMTSCRGSSPPRNRTCVSSIPCIGRWVLYHWCHLVSPLLSIPPAILHQEHVMNWMPIRCLCNGLDAPLNGLFFWHIVAPFLGNNMLRVCMVPGRDEGKDGRKVLWFFF